MAADSP